MQVELVYNFYVWSNPVIILQTTAIFYYLDIYLEMQYNVTIQKGINQFRAEGNEPETGQKIFITTSHKKM